MALVIGAPATLVVRAAKHVNPKATKHHTKTRPKKVRRLGGKSSRWLWIGPKTLNPQKWAEWTRHRACLAGRPPRPRAARPSRPRPSRHSSPFRDSRRPPSTSSLTSNPPPPTSSKQLRPSDRNRKQVEYPEIKAEEIPPVMTVVSAK